MHKKKIWIAMGCCLFATALLAWAQAKIKPGLYEMTTTITWQQSPLPPGMTMPGEPVTAPVCVTQAMIDKYGAPVQQNNKDCKISNIVIRPGGMSAEIACTGMLSAKGSIEMTWMDGSSSHTKTHMIGSMQMGSKASPVEFTGDSTFTSKAWTAAASNPCPCPRSSDRRPDLRSLKIGPSRKYIDRVRNALLQ